MILLKETRHYLNILSDQENMKNNNLHIINKKIIRNSIEYKYFVADIIMS